MVHEIVPNAFVLHLTLHARLAQHFRIANAGELKDLRRL